MEPVFLTILMPCLNEERTLANCIRKAQAYLSRAQFAGEIIVADNRSTDASRDIAQSLGARVVDVERRGYGNALWAGINAARGKYVIMGDADDSYDFLQLDGFVDQLQAGCDLVIGNRFTGGIRPGAMPALHRYFGNPLLSLLGRRFFGIPISDFYCGLRGFRREAILSLGLTASGMEFALEMIVKAAVNRLAITEIPTTLSPDGRDRPPHLRSFSDGWRSLRLYLLMCPRWLFLYPGALLAIGVQSVFFWAFASIVGAQMGLLPLDASFDRFRRMFTLERSLAIGSALIVCGFGAALYALIYWYELSFGELPGDLLIKAVCSASFLAVLGFQLIFSAFFICLLDQAAEPVVATPPARRHIAPAAAES